MDQERRDAAAWAQEWAIRKKNRRIIRIIAALVLIWVFGMLVNLISVRMTRMTFGSEEEMRKSLQGRYAIDRSYEDIIIEGDDITVTYYEVSHYNLDYAREYGYSEEFGNTVYEAVVTEWDYRHGVIKTDWMDDIIVDQDGNLIRYRTSKYVKTDKPAPTPIDPAELNSSDSGDAVITDEEAEAIEQREESLEKTEEEQQESSEALDGEKEAA